MRRHESFTPLRSTITIIPFLIHFVEWSTRRDGETTGARAVLCSIVYNSPSTIASQNTCFRSKLNYGVTKTEYSVVRLSASCLPVYPNWNVLQLVVHSIKHRVQQLFNRPNWIWVVIILSRHKSLLVVSENYISDQDWRCIISSASLSSHGWGGGGAVGVGGAAENSIPS